MYREVDSKAFSSRLRKYFTNIPDVYHIKIQTDGSCLILMTHVDNMSKHHFFG